MFVSSLRERRPNPTDRLRVLRQLVLATGLNMSQSLWALSNLLMLLQAVHIVTEVDEGL